MNFSAGTVVRLADVCVINPRRVRIERPDQEPTSFVPMSAVDERTGSITDMELQPYSHVSRGYTYFEEGDVLFAKITPCMQNGKHAIARGLKDGIGFGSTEFHVLRPCANLDSEWLWFFLRRPEYLRKAQESFSGAVGQQRVPEAFLSKSLIPLPDLPTQRRIAARLKEQMAGVEAARKAVEEQRDALSKLTAACLREAFEANSGNWPTKPLGDICEIQLGKMLSAKSRTGKTPALYLRNQNVQWGRFDLRSIASMDFSQQERIKFALQPGDLMVCEGGEPGRAAVWNGEIDNCFYQKALFRLRPINGCADTHYLLYRLQFGALTGEFADSNAKSTIAHLPAVRLAKLAIPLPDFQTQRQVAARLREQIDRINAARAVLEEQMEAVSALPAAYLRDAFGGIS